ncbi:MAG: hypothetical protein AABZ83_15525 [candidate division NC10 bacterium]
MKPKPTTQQALTVTRRTTAGTRPVSRMRREGLVPGVVYGRDMEPLAVTVNRRELVKLLHAKAGEHALVTLRLEDGKPWEKPVLMQASSVPVAKPISPIRQPPLSPWHG